MRDEAKVDVSQDQKRLITWLVRWGPVAVWMAFIFFMSSRSSFPMPGISWIDEVIRIGGHFSEYGVLGFLLSRAMTPARISAKLRLAAILVWASAYALSDEWHQSFVPNRDASLFDGSVDVLGTLAGCWLYFKRMKNEG